MTSFIDVFTPGSSRKPLLGSSPSATAAAHRRRESSPTSWLTSPLMLMNAAPLGGGVSADCPPTCNVHVGAPPVTVSSLYLLTPCSWGGGHVWVRAVHVACVVAAWLIESALSFQVESETVAFTSSSASEKVGQVRARGVLIGVRSHSSCSRHRCPALFPLCCSLCRLLHLHILFFSYSRSFVADREVTIQWLMLGFVPFTHSLTGSVSSKEAFDP